MPPGPDHALLRLDPVPRLIDRVRAELAGEFDPARPSTVARAPGRLDVMGGIADYTGSLVCEMPLDRAAAVMSQRRDDGIVQAFSFNLLDEHQPFTLRLSIGDLADASITRLRADLSEPGRRWAGYLIGCLAVAQDEGLVDLKRDLPGGVNLAVLSTVPLGAGVSSSAAIEVATCFALLGLLGEAVKRPDLRVATRLGEASETRDPHPAMRLAALCQRVENEIVGAPCGIMDQVTSCFGREGELLKLLCQPHEVQGFLSLPPGVRVIGINSNVKHSVGGGMYGRTRCAAFMAHAMILQRMAELGTAAGMTLTGDPMRGYLANLDPEDYKQLFRPSLPESLRGSEFLARFGRTIDSATGVDPTVEYPVQPAADHHVLEARRVRQFVQFIEQAGDLSPGPDREKLLRKAGHLMYASHKSYRDKAMLGAPECDLLVELVEKHESAGLYGGKITGGGSGGTVAVLCDATPSADSAIGRIMSSYAEQTGHKPEAFTGSSPGAWWVGVAQ